ncbi:unnamed protein product [Heligmosomoides polygyrus]|uniref:CNH domain-containing protein n=1 Tax=Heligmosomoides polygyrus TaxID=6339 RepID=A0A183F6C3_HELPZ|nr:unnamed protein product [Heligmosomoides polygyrus]
MASRCGWAITIDHFELCRMAEETAKSSNKVLLSSQYKLEARVQLAHKIAPILKGALYKFNVLRVPSLRTLYENAIGEKKFVRVYSLQREGIGEVLLFFSTDDMLKYGSDDMLKYGSQLLSLQEQYQNKDDLALCHLRYGLAQAYKSAGKDDLCRELIRGAREMSVDFGWRRFNFFDKSIVQDPENPNEKFLGLKDVCVDCWCSGVGGEAGYLGEQRGGVFRLGRELDENYWKAYQTSLTALHVADEFIFSIGVRINTIHPSSHYSVAACAVAVHSSLSAVAVGFVDGTVLLYQGAVIKDKALTSRWQRIRDPLPLDGPVTGIALAQLPGEKLVVFVITSKVVSSYVVENKAVINSVSSAELLVKCHRVQSSSFQLKHDATGATKDCWTFDERTGSLVVASRDVGTAISTGTCAAHADYVLHFTDGVFLRG